MFIIFIVIMVASMLVQSKLKSKFAYYSQIHLQNGMSGKEVAEKMLRENGINDVQVISVPGQLSDHYNPANKTVNLSEGVYMERNAAAAAVAAHECGHAIQHKVGYSMLKLRTSMVPIVNISSKILQFIFFFGFFAMAFLHNNLFLYVAAVLFGITALFAIVTLPVEYDASNRALAWLKSSGTVGATEYEAAQDSLKWAARTYVVSALGAIAQFLYFLNASRR